MYTTVHTHTHAAHMGYSDVSPGVLGCEPRTPQGLEAPKNPDGLNFGVYTFVYVYKVHMCMYMLGGGMRSWNNSFFLEHILPSKKEKQKT